jgi:ribonuclease VapC
MIVDASAVVAIALREGTARELLEALAAAPTVRISAANLLESWMVIDRRNIPEATALADRILTRFGIEIQPVTATQVEMAREAWRRYGRGSGHRAQLNFGDCFAYALAKDLDEPLLFVGEDFAATDVMAALASE